MGNTYTLPIDRPIPDPILRFRLTRQLSDSMTR
jgi:hypothetical protein